MTDFNDIDVNAFRTQQDRAIMSALHNLEESRQSSPAGRTANAVEALVAKLDALSDDLETERQERKSADDVTMKYTRRQSRVAIMIAAIAAVFTVAGFVVSLVALLR